MNARSHGRLFLVWIGLALLLPASVLAQTNVATAAALNAALPNPTFSVLRFFGSLAVVVALFLAGVWCFKNWQRFTIYKGRAPQLQVLEVRPLGGRQALYLVGYKDQRFLIAASPAGINLLTHLPDGEGPAVGAGAPETFSRSLERALMPQP